jgi:DNA-binding SARP family transcriptional activator
MTRLEPQLDHGGNWLNISAGGSSHVCTRPTTFSTGPFFLSATAPALADVKPAPILDADAGKQCYEFQPCGSVNHLPSSAGDDGCETIVRRQNLSANGPNSSGLNMLWPVVHPKKVSGVVATNTAAERVFGPARRVSIHLFGRFRLEVTGNQPTRLPQKAQAVLAYLASEMGQPVLRDQLADLAWSRSGCEHARQSLRQAILSIRQALALDPNCVIVPSGSDSIMLVGAEVDVRDFHRLSNSGILTDLERAAKLCQGEFLNGLTSVGEIFDDWRVLEQSRLTDLASRVLMRLADIYSAAERHENAIAMAQRLVALDPIREDSHRLLIRCYSVAHRRSEALRQFDKCRSILKRELGVQPDVLTARLEKELRDDEITKESSNPNRW